MKESAVIQLQPSAHTYISFSFNNVKYISGSKGIILAADIGGTKTNLALFELKDDVLKPVYEQTFVTKNYSSFFDLYKSFKNKDLPEIDSICLGVAGPVINGKVSGTNFSWEIDEQEIKKELGVKWVTVLNDLEATAYGIAALQKDDFKEIKGGSKVAGNGAIISPGTGLGEAGLFWDGKAYHPFATEGGHCDFSPRTEFDIEFLRHLQKQYGHVSWERIISGPGIFNIYKFLKAFKNIEEPKWFSEKILKEDPAAVISSCATTNTYPACGETIELFTRYLATETAQLALKFKATGGIFIGGGIIPKIINIFDKKLFIENFLQVNRMNPLLENIPVQLILNQYAPKYGTALYAAMQLNAVAKE